ncbi:MAG: ketoacyl-ACP synthase III [Armatimonadetes bacterium]|jgi:3-oxoacyl-[acyl-carrier-protein] synthase-3|nr:ketoacyl-ACP synthase III [Armatimonadota bacterium]
MSELRNAGIISMGSALPDRVLTNADLEKMVDTSDEWIRSMTGVRERRIAAEGEGCSDYAVKAARLALERAKLEPDDLDLIIVATFTGDQQLPSTACLVQSALGCVGTPAFDVAAACSGFVYSLAMADVFIRSGVYNRILVIGVELLSSVTNWTDRGTCVLFGDGAGAAIVGPVESGTGMISFDLGADGTGVDALKIPAGGSKMPVTHENLDEHANKVVMAGREVFKFAVKVQSDAIEHVLTKAGLTTDDIDMVIPHAANIRIIDSAVNRLGLPPEKFFTNLEKCGNTSAASIPLALDEAVQAGKVKKGDTVVLVGFGGGLTWAASLMKWVY